MTKRNPAYGNHLYAQMEQGKIVLPKSIGLFKQDALVDHLNRGMQVAHTMDQLHPTTMHSKVKDIVFYGNLNYPNNDAIHLLLMHSCDGSGLVELIDFDISGIFDSSYREMTIMEALLDSARADIKVEAMSEPTPQTQTKQPGKQGNSVKTDNVSFTDLILKIGNCSLFSVVGHDKPNEISVVNFEGDIDTYTCSDARMEVWKTLIYHMRQSTPIKAQHTVLLINTLLFYIDPDDQVELLTKFKQQVAEADAVLTKEDLQEKVTSLQLELCRLRKQCEELKRSNDKLKEFKSFIEEPIRQPFPAPQPHPYMGTPNITQMFNTMNCPNCGLVNVSNGRELCSNCYHRLI